MPTVVEHVEIKKTREKHCVFIQMLAHLWTRIKNKKNQLEIPLRGFRLFSKSRKNILMA